PAPRIKRASVEGPAPVNVITAAQIQKEGFVSVYAPAPRIKRASVEGPAPVNVITAAQIQKEGFVSV
ncbi:hypothetical protein C7E17_27420, partial [Stenotrophomonas maltophilia]